MITCCPCDRLEHPAKPDIAAGLPALPRQLAGFPEYRLAMLRDIAVHAPLSQWRAREGDDLGIMLLEMWAYALDILGFYDERIANESYLRTAQRRPSLRRMVGLIGYRPRPALGASVVLAALADGHRPVTLPPRTGFRSDAFDDEPPQVFETEIEQTIHALNNQWPLAPVRNRFAGKELLLEPGTTAIDIGQRVLLRWFAPGAVNSDPELHAGRVTGLRTIDALDGESYLRMEMEPAPELDAGADLGAIDVLSPRLGAVPNLIIAKPLPDVVAVETVPDTTGIILDAVYPQFTEQAAIIVQLGGELHAAVVTAVKRTDVKLGDAEVESGDAYDSPTLPATGITLSPALPASWLPDRSRLVIHYDMTSSGRLTRPAKTHLEVADFEAPGVPVDGIVEPLPDGVKGPTTLLLRDAQDHGTQASGGVDIEPDGTARVRLVDGTAPFAPSPRTPVTVYGNAVRATRGESVFNEVLGSGDGALALQSFILANSPLTYLNDPAAHEGRRSTLELRVNGIAWQEVPSFFGTGSQDEVYIVRHNDDQEAVVTFGDGVRGARLPTGVDNVTAIYRFGAGAAKPPAGVIGQLARPVEGLGQVVSPVAAGGGADADRSEDIQRNAPTSALLLGRAVSPLDFVALAREFGGVVNAHVEWAWDERCQGAVVKVWFISDGGKIAKGLKAFLVGQADPTTPLAAVEAQAQPSSLVVELEIMHGFSPPLVIEQARQALTDSETGLLAPANIPIGQPLFRSRIFEVMLAVTGVLSVRTLTLDGQPAPAALTTAEGDYRDFSDELVITGTVTATA